MRFIYLITLMLSLSSYGAEYIVQPGDTLSSIAQDQLGGTEYWKELAAINGIRKPFTVKVGQKLQIPNLAQGADEHESFEEIMNASQEAPPDNVILTWKFFLIGAIVSWLYWSLCLKGGCWFSLVEISWKKSLLFPFFMILGITVLIAAVILIPGRQVNNGLISTNTFFSMGFICVFLAMLITIIFLKRYLDCKWRSIFTVLVMTVFLANVLSILTMVLLSTQLSGIDAIQQMAPFFQE